MPELEPLSEQLDGAPIATRAERTARLFAQAATAGDRTAVAELREQIVLLNVGVAHGLARRYLHRGEPEDDLRQVALEALVKAVHRFDPARGKDFLSYAVPTISGELKKHFRDRCWTVQVPRRIQQLQTRLGPVTDELAQQLGRRPEVGELAAALGVGADEVREALCAAGCFQPDSLDVRAAAGDRPDALAAPESRFAQVETQLQLRPVIRALPERDRTILGLRFFGGCTQAQIATRLGITQMQVSRLLSQIMLRLQQQLAA